MKAPRMRSTTAFWLVLSVLPGCGAEGEGSIKADRTQASGVMRAPDRKAPPPQTKARGGRTAPKSILPRR